MLTDPLAVLAIAVLLWIAAIAYVLRMASREGISPRTTEPPRGVGRPGPF